MTIPSLIGPMLGPVVGGFIVGWLDWRLVFFVNLPIGFIGLYVVYRYLPDYRAGRSDRLDLVGLILFGSGVALLSYVLEIFGENTLSGAQMLALAAFALTLLLGYGRHAAEAAHPLLRLGMFRIRTFRAGVAGSFVTRLGAGGTPFLLPLLYQVGLGYSPVQSGLLIMAQPFAAMSLKMTMPLILERLGYRYVLLSNTVLMGSMLMLFATIGARTPVWLILCQGFVFGFCSSLQYTSMNTLAYADVRDADASMASSIASAMQQMSMSFGVAMAALATALFIPDSHAASAAQMIHGIHLAFITLGGLTIVSALVFLELRHDDGASVSHHKASVPAGRLGL